MNLKLVCKHLNDCVKKALEDGWPMKSLKRYLESKIPEIPFNDLCRELQINNAAISGSCLLQWALGEEYNSDIDIFYCVRSFVQSNPHLRPTLPGTINDNLSLYFYSRFKDTYTCDTTRRQATNYNFLLATDPDAVLGPHGEIQPLGLSRTAKFFIHNMVTKNNTKLQLIEIEGKTGGTYPGVPAEYDTIEFGTPLTEPCQSVKIVLGTFDFDMLRNTFDGYSLRLQNFHDVSNKLLVRCENLCYSKPIRLQKYLQRGFVEKTRRRNYD